MSRKAPERYLFVIYLAGTGPVEVPGTEIRFQYRPLPSAEPEDIAEDVEYREGFEEGRVLGESPPHEAAEVGKGLQGAFHPDYLLIVVILDGTDVVAEFLHPIGYVTRPLMLAPESPLQVADVASRLDNLEAGALGFSRRLDRLGRQLVLSQPMGPPTWPPAPDPDPEVVERQSAALSEAVATAKADALARRRRDHEGVRFADVDMREEAARQATDGEGRTELDRRMNDDPLGRRPDGSTDREEDDVREPAPDSPEGTALRVPP